MRAWTLRLLVGPTKDGPTYRDPRVVWAAHDASSGRCVACGRRGQVNAHHVRGLAFAGADHLDNIWMLCQRAGAPSCHGVVTGTERWVRDVRKRIGTYQDGAGRPTPLPVVGWRLVRRKEAWWWGLALAPVLGLVWHPPLVQVAAVAALVALGPVWAWSAAWGSRRDYLPSPQGNVDPKHRTSPMIEWLKAKSGRGFRERETLRTQNARTARTFRRRYLLRWLRNYLAGAWAVWLVSTLPVALWTLATFLV